MNAWIMILALAQIPSKPVVTVQHITVDEGVQLEVVGWGGKGRPLVLLAGYQTAHVYDDFAPKLTSFGRVYGITRRGYGTSSRPSTGYSTGRHAEDSLRVLDALHLEKPILLGHSFGANDMTALAERYPDRIGALVYLNSAEDPSIKDFGAKWPDPDNLPAALRWPKPKEDKSSIAAYRASQKKLHGVAFPEAELRQMYAMNPDGSLGAFQFASEPRDAIFKAMANPEFGKLKVPVLAIYAMPEPLDDMVRKYSPKEDLEREALAQQHRTNIAWVEAQRNNLLRRLPSAQVVLMPSANYYIFQSHAEELAREIRAFLPSIEERN